MRKTKQEVVSEFRCTEILDAARRVFAKKGFNGATVDAIADSAGVAKGTVYLYFRSKREIYLEALQRGLEGLLQETRKNVAAAPTLAGKVHAFISTRVRYADENRDFISIYHAEFAKNGASVLKRGCRDLYLQQAAALAEMLEAAMDRGEIRPMRADAAAFALYEMTRGFISQRLLGSSKATADEDIDFLFELIWNGLAVPAGAGIGKETQCIA